MLTKQDEQWLNHLSDTNPVKIIPYNPKVKEVFEKQKWEIQQALGKNVSVEHRGATSLGISGKGDIDIYLPIDKKQWDAYLNKLKRLFGKPGSIYPYERARWNREVDGFEIEIFLINESHPGWIKSIKFENYLKTHPDALDQYRRLKDEANGLSTREYYRRKIEFINDILLKIGT